MKELDIKAIAALLVRRIETKIAEGEFKRGSKRCDMIAFELWMGASAAIAAIYGEKSTEATKMFTIAVMVVNVRGYAAIKEMAEKETA